MIKKLLSLLAIFVFLFLPKSVFAFKADTFVTFANPVRGYEGWSNVKQTPLDLPKFQYQESTPSALPNTWLLRFDAVNDSTISAYFEKLLAKDQNQSLGAFLEITPSLTEKAGVNYPQGISMFNANRIFLSGYTQKDRLRLIDTFMNTFFSRYGFYPKSVAAWQLDSYSLQYLQSKYSVLTAMNCDDQYSTDMYRLWGGYLGSPYFPDKNNSLVPASSLSNRVNLTMVRWAQRDLFNFYGYKSESSFSVQVNDYLSKGKTTKYFDSLLDQYGQITFNEFNYINVGLENDYSLQDYHQEIKNVFQSLKTTQDKNKYNLHFISLSDFGDWMKARYPESSPTYFYRTADPTGAVSGDIDWYQSPHYRIGLKTVNGKTNIIDFRVYNRNIYEENFATPNQNLNLYSEIPAVIDSVKYPGSQLPLDVDLSGFQTSYDKQWDYREISLVKGNQKITFDIDSISFTNIKAPSISTKDVKITTNNSGTIWKVTPYTPLNDYLHYSWVFWLLLSVTLTYLIYRLIKKNGKPKIPFYLIIGFICVSIAGLTVLRNGLNFPFGLGFFGPNGHDAIFHISLIQKFSENPLNFDHPQYAGVRLSNYHFIFDYFSGVISKIFQIPANTLYFRILPVILGIILVCLLNKLMTKWLYSPFEKALGYIFVFLSGSFGFIPSLIFSHDIFAGESTFWANQSVSLFLNPPFLLSIIFLLLILINFPGKEKVKPLQFIFLVFLGGILAQTKVYAFVILEAALLINRNIKLAIATGIFGILISLPFSSFSGLPFIFDPFWFTKSLFASYDRLYWPQLVQAWQSYEASGNFPKLIAINAFALFIFLLGNLGMRLFGFSEMLKKPVNPSQKITFGIIIIGIILPLVIIQTDNPWNTIQFMYYSLFFLSLFTAKVVSRIFGHINNLFLKIIFLIVFLVPATITSIGTLRDYIGSFSSSRISYTEMSALETLKSQPTGIVLSPIYVTTNRIATPKPLYSYVSTAYISAYSGQPEFISDTINLDITGFNYTERSRDVQRFYVTEDKTWAKNFLKNNNIRYVYETPLQKMSLNPEDISLTKIFDSGEINIYKTN